MSIEPPMSFPHSPFVPFDPRVTLYETAGWCGGGYAQAWEYTGWRDEVLSWKNTAYLHGHLNPSPTYRLKGPDALRLLADTCTNSFEVFSVGASKHALMCNDDGLLMAHGMLLRVADDEFLTYWLAPWLPYLVEKFRGDYDVTGEDLTGQVFLFQIAGPNSLDILEQATGEDLRDINFLRHRTTRVADADVRILRVGMAGVLAYELHGDLEDAQAVYRALVDAGEPLGLRRLGIHAYLMNHTENGFPQMLVHFLPAWGSEPGLAGFLSSGGERRLGAPGLAGSLAARPDQFLRNPIDLGWQHLVRLDHDFIGRRALEPQLVKPARTMVTLEWNPDDIARNFASQFGPSEPYAPMIFAGEHPAERSFGGQLVTVNDEVRLDGAQVGVSSGRTYSLYYRQMISLCSLDTAVAEIGTEVKVLWGEPGSNQQEIRATVARFPYLDLDRNENIDVRTLPRRDKVLG